MPVELVNGRQGFDEMMAVTRAVRARTVATVLRKELEAVIRLDDQAVTIAAPESVGAAGDGGKDVVRVHCAQDEVRPVPRRPATAASQPARPSFKARHADGAEVLLTSFHRHGNAGL